MKNLVIVSENDLYQRNDVLFACRHSCGFDLDPGGSHQIEKDAKEVVRWRGGVRSIGPTGTQAVADPRLSSYLGTLRCALQGLRRSRQGLRQPGDQAQDGLRALRRRQRSGEHQGNLDRQGPPL